MSSGRLDYDHRTIRTRNAEIAARQAYQVAADLEAIHADHWRIG